LTFTNLKGSAYKKGNLIVEGTLKKESKNSPLCKLASFTDMIVEDCALNESKTGTNISVCVNAIGEDNMKRLYEWLKKYTNEDKISEIAPGLLESLGLTNNSEEQVNEDSVASRFSKYRKLYEADDEEEPEKDEDKDDDKGDDADKDSEDKKSDSAGESKKEDDGDDPEDDEDEEELTAVIIEVKKGDEEAAKQEMIDAGVDEDDIEILEPEKDDDEDDDTNTDEDNPENENEDDDKDTDDSSDETVKIKVSVDSFDALKSYLEDKGFDLEKELGGEIVTDDEDEDEDNEDDKKEKDEMEDTFDGFDDLFGDMGDEENDEKK
jgi:hypothetical protein